MRLIPSNKNFSLWQIHRYVSVNILWRSPFCSTLNRNNFQGNPTIPPHPDRFGEPLKIKRARLLYQSRKRGMLENDLILSAFAHKYLKEMTEEELSLYDRLINLPSNDWEIYYWVTGVKKTPPEFDNEIMNKLKEFVKNKEREQRIRQPDLT